MKLTNEELLTVYEACVLAESAMAVKDPKRMAEFSAIRMRISGTINAYDTLETTDEYLVTVIEKVKI